MCEFALSRAAFDFGRDVRAAQYNRIVTGQPDFLGAARQLPGRARLLPRQISASSDRMH
jgi:hypothetical protein